MSIEHIESGPRMSQAVGFGSLVFLAGQVADDLEGDVESQTRQVLAKIERLLALANSDKSRILSATIWLTNANAFSAFNRIWEDWIPTGSAPARATVVAQLVAPGFLIEIQLIASRPQE